MSFENINVYLLASIMSFASGLGLEAGKFFFNHYLKKRIINLRSKIKNKNAKI